MRTVGACKMTFLHAADTPLFTHAIQKATFPLIRLIRHELATPDTVSAALQRKVRPFRVSGRFPLRKANFRGISGLPARTKCPQNSDRLSAGAGQDTSPPFRGSVRVRPVRRECPVTESRRNSPRCGSEWWDRPETNQSTGYSYRTCGRRPKCRGTVPCASIRSCVKSRRT